MGKYRRVWQANQANAGMTPPSHWRIGEEYIEWVERVVDAPKIWDLLVELPPSPQHQDAYEAEVEFSTPTPDLTERGLLLMRAHREEGGAIFITLFAGNTVLRRAHIGGSHQEPDAGPLIPGPHIHYPTTVFQNIGSRHARSRAYPWSTPPFTSLREAIGLFAREVGIIGDPQEHTRLTGGA
jgi:hypothetical protein